LRLAEVAEVAGRTETARVAWRDLDAFTDIADERLLALVEVQRLDSVADEDDQGDWFAAVRDTTDRAIEIFESAGDHYGMARAYWVRGFSEWVALRVSSAESAWELAVAHAHEAGETGREADALSWIAVTGLYGIMPVDEAVPRLRDAARRLAGSVRAQGMVEGCLSTLLGMQGHQDEAQAVLHASLERWREYGLDADLAHYGSQSVAWLERCAGNAEAELQAWLDGLEASRHLDQENRFLASMAAVLFAARGEVDEAVPLIELAHPEEWAGNLQMRTLLLQASAIVDVRRENAEGARQQVREVTDMMATTEFLVHTGDAWMSTALIERLIGDETASEAAVDRAVELYRTKGAVALIPPARSWQRESSGSAL